MAIAFFNPISEDFHTKLSNASYPDGKIEVCVNNIQNFVSIIKTFHGLCKCDLKNCQVPSFPEDLESYGKELRKSRRLLRKNFTALCKKYPVGFRDCVALAQNRYFMMISRPNNNDNNLEKNGGICSANRKRCRIVIITKI